MPTLIELPDLQANVHLCRRLGLDFIELNMNSPLFLPQHLPATELREVSRREGVGFTLHLPEQLDLGAFQPEVRQGHVRCVTAAVQWAGEAGIDKLSMHLNGGVYFTLPDRRVWMYEQYRGQFLSALTESVDCIVSAPQAAGTRLLIENAGDFHLGFLCEAVEVLLERFRARVGLTYDVGHDAGAGFCDRPVMERHTGDIAHMHLHDFDGRSSHQALFTGTVDIPAALELARRLAVGVVLETKTAEALESSVAALRTRGLF
ncbi:MAG: sugar phosphate isomerase/epimerase [Phycisphaerae bacterium]|nr:sugar phosphate isomerase/epimerase [Phycisphaerae bacterium]